MLRSKKIVSLLFSAMLVCGLALTGCGASEPASTSNGSNASTGGSAGSGTGDNGANGGTAATGATFKTVKPGVITVGSDLDYPPFIEQGSGGGAAGFEKEMMELVAGAMGYKVEYLNAQKFDTILGGVAAGTNMDVGVSSFTINPTRLELVSFSTPYFDANQAVVTLKTKTYKTALDLDGKTVAAQAGTTGEDWVNENLRSSGTKLISYKNTSDALAAMMAGEVEAVFFDEPVAKEQVKSTYSDAKIVEVIATGEQYGIAVSKDNPELLKAVNEALISIKKDGSFDKLFEKYFPDIKTSPSLGVK